MPLLSFLAAVAREHIGGRLTRGPCRAVLPALRSLHSGTAPWGRTKPRPPSHTLKRVSIAGHRFGVMKDKLKCVALTGILVGIEYINASTTT
ncbi:hypothetical protein HNY73_020983 [Argiope bruennichi]|uniref:Uncharacterized protein n=1 Tax=Argiope bruennichi TaxID=94029 RepID=A0A8T0EBB3_ARGBR|nr:hypothetical protein HNY73_020983 [Argiope bruennichi]